jgi:murein L,D-transpeptidase YcbB/YkuD
VGKKLVYIALIVLWWPLLQAVAVPASMTSTAQLPVSIDASDEDLSSWPLNSYLYQDVIEALYQERHDNLLWFGGGLSVPLRQELDWQLLEVSLAGGPAQFGYWLRDIQLQTGSEAVRDRLYTQAFIGLVLLQHRLSQMTYDKASALEEFDLVELQIPAGSRIAAHDVSGQQLYHQLMQMRGRESSALRVRKNISHLLTLSGTDWLFIGSGPMIHPGHQDPRVPLIRQQLTALIDAKSDYEGKPNLLDGQLVEYIKGFQERHGLGADGVIGPDTLNWLNLSPLKRARLLARNLVRLRLFEGQLPSQFLLINVPSYQLNLYRSGALELSSKVIVGRLSRPTPLLTSQISSVVINPPWNVPRSILEKDLLTKLEREPKRMKEQGFTLFDRKGLEVSIDAVDWKEVKNQEKFPYRAQQKPGDLNALGRYKFHFSNRYAVYLHDTPSQGLFRKSDLDLSSGCVRVERAPELADYLLHKAGYASEYTQEVLGSGETKWLSLSARVPIYTVYWTAWVEPSGLPQYRQDIYRLDAKVLDDEHYLVANIAAFTHS